MADIENMTEREMRRSEWGFKAGLLLTGAAIAMGVAWCLTALLVR